MHRQPLGSPAALANQMGYAPEYNPEALGPHRDMRGGARAADRGRVGGACCWVVCWPAALAPAVLVGWALTACPLRRSTGCIGCRSPRRQCSRPTASPSHSALSSLHKKQCRPRTLQ